MAEDNPGRVIHDLVRAIERSSWAERQVAKMWNPNALDTAELKWWALRLACESTWDEKYGDKQ